MKNAEVTLSILNKKSRKDPNYVFERIYRILFNLDLFLKGYVNIYSHEGNMTPGINGKNHRWLQTGFNK